MRRVLITLGLGALAAIGLAAGMTANGTAADNPAEPPGNHVPVAICHRHNSETNPYNYETPDNDSIIKAGHGDHTGDVFQSGMKEDKDKWGDIIPPFTWWELEGKGNDKSWVLKSFPGLNMPAGTAILANKCVVPTPPEKGTLIVKKVVVNNDGQTKGFTDFSFTVNGGAAVSFDGDGEISMEVAPGDYTVLEVAVAGYTTTYDDNTVTVAKGGTAAVTITNNDVADETETTPTDTTPTDTTPTDTTPTDTTSTDTTTTDTTPTTTTETTPAAVPAAPFTPPKASTKPAAPKKVVKATKPGAKPTKPTVKVAGAVAENPPKLAYTP
jgi:Prealbumin-like fold domain